MARWSARVTLIVVSLLFVAGVPAFAAGDVPQADRDPLLWTTSLAWLIPIGLGLLACGAVPPGRVAAVIRVGWLALGVSVIGYWLCGFAFQFGGLGFVLDHPDLAGLVREWQWAPLDAMWGTQWGMLGLEGYMLRGPASTPTALSLFLSQLPWITTAVAIPLWSLQGRTRPFALFMSGVLIAFAYTLIGNWTWGGGWLANLGLNLNLGHGFVDFAGAGAVHLAGAASALAGMLAFGTRVFMRPRAEQLPLPTLDTASNGNANAPTMRLADDGETYVPMPPLHLPILGTLGAWLVVIGWVGWGLSNPAHVAAGLDVAWTEMLIGLMLAAAGGAVVALAFSWLTTGEGNALMTARGVLGAVVAISAGLPFMPFWAALAVGAGAGLLVPLVQYLVEHVLRLDDPTSAVATHGVSALWGLLAVGLFGDGRAGQGWNRVGADTYLSVNGQGVTGYLAAAGYVSDWPGQFQAQAAGATAIFLAAFFLSWLLFAAIQGLTKAWQGEYTIRLPRRPRPKRVRPRTTKRRWPRVRVVRAAEGESGSEAKTKRSGKDVTSSLRSWFAAIKSWGNRIRKRIGALMRKKRRLPPAGEDETVQEPDANAHLGDDQS